MGVNAYGKIPVTPPNRMLSSGHGDVQIQMTQRIDPEGFAEHGGLAHLLQQFPEGLGLQSVDLDVHVLGLFVHVFVAHAAAHEVGPSAALYRKIGNAPCSCGRFCLFHALIIAKC